MPQNARRYVRIGNIPCTWSRRWWGYWWLLAPGETSFTALGHIPRMFCSLLAECYLMGNVPWFRRGGVVRHILHPGDLESCLQAQPIEHLEVEDFKLTWYFLGSLCTKWCIGLMYCVSLYCWRELQCSVSNVVFFFFLWLTKHKCVLKIL